VAQQPPVGRGLLIIEASRSYSDTIHSVGTLWTSYQPVAQTCTSQRTALKTDVHVSGRIRTLNPSKQAAADPRLRPRGHRDQLTFLLRLTKLPIFCIVWNACSIVLHLESLWTAVETIHFFLREIEKHFSSHSACHMVNVPMTLSTFHIYTKITR